MAAILEARLFDLTEKAVEQIVFAMEDQERASVVDLETGEVLPAEGLAGERYVPPPTWSSREGFKLMEDFLASVRQPSVRRELSAALARGRGVFKAFKAALAQREDLERAFRDFKIKAMRRTIAVWYDDAREARGLERLGPEPEDTNELLSSDLNIRIIGLAAGRALLEPLIDEIEEECLEYLPEPVAAFEIDRLREELEAGGDAAVAIADDGEGGALGAALAFRDAVDDRALGRISFAFVRRDFRRMGLGRALLESLAASLRAEGIPLLVLDSPFLPPEMGSALTALGFKPYGQRALSRLD
jgi:GNAT superfamily N-acetyltransferase